MSLDRHRARGLAHPLELLDPDGEGIYVLPSSVGGRSQALAWAAHTLGCYWRDMTVETVAFLRDGDEYRRASFKSWRWMLPERWSPVAYLYCTPPNG